MVFPARCKIGRKIRVTFGSMRGFFLLCVGFKDIKSVMSLPQWRRNIGLNFVCSHFFVFITFFKLNH